MKLPLSRAQRSGPGAVRSPRAAKHRLWRNRASVDQAELIEPERARFSIPYGLDR
jgi:hypothetical protein